MIERQSVGNLAEPSSRLQSARSKSLVQTLTWLVLALAMAGPIIFSRLGTKTIEIWDESRVADNAIEMARSGLSFITTYQGAIDYWNTKPPLVVWLEVCSVRLFGENEWAVRFPSAVAALLTVLMIYCVLARRVSPMTGYVAGGMLVSTIGYIGYHGARAADYDATLTLWTTAMLISAHAYIRSESRFRSLWMAACAVSMALAFLTKTIEGLIFLPAILAYVFVEKRGRAVFSDPLFYLGIVFVAVCGIGYYYLRTKMDPPYWSAAWQNDFGRYSSAKEHNSFGPLFYLKNPKQFPCTVVSLLISIYLGWKDSGWRRSFAIFLGMTEAFYLFIISAGTTKLIWYEQPMAPLGAMIVGLGFSYGVEYAGRRFKGMSSRAFKTLLTIGLLLFGALVVTYNVIAENHRETQERHSPDPKNYDEFLRNAVFQNGPARSLIVIQKTFHNDQDLAFYNAPTVFYVTTLQHKGWKIDAISPSQTIPKGYDEALVCDDLRQEEEKQGRLKVVTAGADCTLYSVLASKPA
ncbi:glycosyltransferase family 39 protein [Robbsia sp. Bb-Pol-6]|uniref:Glycosyltransferase family 39 protein n=1 Tax=Robbsia betulipollinis TaxID=2981849 RepID=A0ABT3ZIP1_9BURK|nr:glycosyltransferase family 39 protein [Robbsia betulipollinis]MCY0386287.1 glycosyltransferase family 39 protein [Robbsia betulipollinis]